MDHLFHIILAVVLGSCIGLERQVRQRDAGLRTNTLVALGAAIFMTLGLELGGDAPGRLASYIISGMGFLGAGVILKDGASIRGLNTAATLWCTAAIGAFCGAGYMVEPIVGTALIITVHLVLRPISTKLRNIGFKDLDAAQEYTYRFTVYCREAVENHIRVLFVQYLSNNDKLMLRSINSSETKDDQIALITSEVISLSNQDTNMEKIASFLTLEKDVISVKWELKGSAVD